MQGQLATCTVLQIHNHDPELSEQQIVDICDFVRRARRHWHGKLAVHGNSQDLSLIHISEPTRH
eukprot:8292996-Karenia_brevis.AAC.1